MLCTSKPELNGNFRSFDAHPYEAVTDLRNEMPTKVQFIHGSESGPQGVKARLLASTFSIQIRRRWTRSTTNFEGCIAQHANLIQTDKPDVLVGSSFGGAVLVALLQRTELWDGPSLLLAQAALKRGLTTTLPKEVPDLDRAWNGRYGRGCRRQPQASRSNNRAEVNYLELDDDHCSYLSREHRQRCTAGWVRRPIAAPR